MGIEIFNGQFFQLDINGAAHIVNQILRHVDHDKLLNQIAHHGQRIQQSHNQRRMPQCPEIDSAAGAFCTDAVGDDIHHIRQLIGGIGACHGVGNGHHEGQKNQGKLRL